VTVSRAADARESALGGTAGVCPQRPESAKDLGFRRLGMVQWFDPRQLADTALRTLLAGIFGGYADKRELEGVARAEVAIDESRGPDGDRSSLWIDYVADLGDGWDSTYTIASLIAKPDLVVRVDSEDIPTRRADVLVLGGDQVYPTPGRSGYRDRLVGPYTSALPCVAEGQPPSIFAIPGNHDWYDGLTSFLRLFCQGRWIGGWKTRQNRSYFALKLPHHWWLWGVDFQLHADIDLPQLEYFRAMADRLEPSDRVILCTPEPSWIYRATRGAETSRNLEYIENKVIGRSKGRLAVTLSGDLHLYCRHQRADGRVQRIAAGGGGAFLCPTFGLPEDLVLPEPGTSTAAYHRMAEYPSAATSRRLRSLVFRMVWLNPGFPLFVGGLYAAFAWILQTSGRIGSKSLLEALATVSPTSAPLADTLRLCSDSVRHSLAGTFIAAGLVLGLVFWAISKSSTRRPWDKLSAGCAGLVHGLAHLAVVFLLIWLVARLHAATASPLTDSWGQFIVLVAVAVLVGGVAGTLLVALYLFAGNLLVGLHDMEVFSAQRIDDYKHFVRIHIRADGDLDIYPIRVDRVCRHWRLDPDGEPDRPWFSAREEIRHALIESPIHVPGG
jgi:calcineurin-like phosphoesterase family protein